MSKIFLRSLLLVLTFMMCQNVFAYYDSNDPYIYVEKVTDGGYDSGRDGVQSFAATQDIVLSTGGNNIDGDVSVKVYKAQMDDVLDYLIYEGEGKQINTDVSTDDDNLVATMDVQLEDEFTLPVEGNGVWLLHVEADDEDVYMYVIRSQYGTVVKEGKDGLLMWVQDFDSKKSVAGVPIIVYSLRDKIKELTQAKTGDKGIAQTGTSAQYDVAIVGEGDNRSLVPLNLEYLNIGYKSDDNRYQGQKERMRNFIFTDRPLYKPGDTVYFKVISRADDDLVYRIAQGKWTAKLVSGWGDSEEVIVQNEYNIDSYGTISGEMKLPEDIKTGVDYRLEISNDKYEDDYFYGWFGGDNYSTYIQVENYRKPQYELTVSLDKHEYINKDDISFDISGKYFSGEPLANVQAQYSVSVVDFWEATYEDDYLAFAQNNPYGYSYGREIMTNSVTLDANGQAHVSVPTAIDDGKSKVYIITVEYAAQTGEPVIDAENALVYSGEYGIYRTSTQHSFGINKDVSVEFALHENKDGANITDQQLTVIGNRIWYEVRNKDERYLQYDRKEESITPVSMTTNSAGKAIFKFIPSESGSYELTVQGTDDVGNLIKKDFHIWVNSQEQFVPEQDKGIFITLDKDKYNPGDTVNVAITSKTKDRDVLMDIERDFVHRFEVLHIADNTKNINVNLEEVDTPNMYISVNSFADDRLDTAQEEIEITTKSKKLNIDVTPDKEVYAPGDTVTIDIDATDYEGVPQESDIALWAVDKALFELVSQDSYDIHKTYWEHRPGSTSTTDSLRGIWINMAEGGGCFLPGTQVLMDDNKTKNIEDVQVGDNVLTFDDLNNELVSARVIKTHSAVVDGYLTINDTLRVTDNHIVWVNNTWKKAGDIRIGDTMRDKNNQDIVVSSIEWKAAKQQVYNLIVQNVHTYIANGYYVHNGKDGGMRTLFKDVAYWNPHVQTDKNGKATITFELPDDLTTWVISAVGATKNTVVGNATEEIRTTKAVIIRPQLPNILRKGDEAVLVASVHNNTDKDRTFITTLKLSKGEVEKSQQEINIPAGEARIVQWKVLPEYVDENIGLTYSIVAKDNEKINDSVYKEISVEEFGFWETDSIAHTGNEPYDIKIDTDAQNDKTSVELTVSSTIMSSLTGAMNYLIHYPYGCMEQTVSSFMPAVLAREHPEFFGQAMEGKDIDDIIKVGISRLSEKQNTDGGWSWWGGNSDLFLSTYVAEYLVRANVLGYEVDGETLAKSESYFESQMSQAQNSTEQILAVYGRSVFDNDNLPELKVFEQMKSDIVAMAVIANVRDGYTNNSTNGYNILLSQLQDYGNVSYWPAGPKERFGSNDASSGVALRAFLFAGGDTETAERVVKYFLTSRQKEYWTSTFSTAQVLEGFVGYANYEQEKSQNYTAQVFVDDALLSTTTFNVNNTVDTIQIPSNMIKEDGSAISIKPNDQNVTPYSTLLIRQHHTSTEAKPMSRTISIKRSYTNEKGNNYSIGIGDTVIVDFVVEGLKKDDRYFMIEDQLPSGMVPLNEHLDNVAQDSVQNGVYKEYTKNGAILTDSYVQNDGTHLYRYRARVVAGGDYGVPPAQAMLMYIPEVYAHSGSEIVNIKNESQVVSIDGSGVDDLTKKNIFSNTSLHAISISVIGIITLIAFGVAWLIHKRS